MPIITPFQITRSRARPKGKEAKALGSARMAREAHACRARRRWRRRGGALAPPPPAKRGAQHTTLQTHAPPPAGTSFVLHCAVPCALRVPPALRASPTASLMACGLYMVTRWSERAPFLPQSPFLSLVVGPVNQLVFTLSLSSLHLCSPRQVPPSHPHPDSFHPLPTPLLCIFRHRTNTAASFFRKRNLLSPIRLQEFVFDHSPRHPLPLVRWRQVPKVGLHIAHPGSGNLASTAPPNRKELRAGLESPHPRSIPTPTPPLKLTTINMSAYLTYSSPDPTPLRTVAHSVAEAALKSGPNSPSINMSMSELMDAAPLLDDAWVETTDIGTWPRLKTKRSESFADHGQPLWEAVVSAQERREREFGESSCCVCVCGTGR